MRGRAMPTATGSMPQGQGNAIILAIVNGVFLFARNPSRDSRNDDLKCALSLDDGPAKLPIPLNSYDGRTDDS